ncbi:Protein of unknown function [Bacillus cereus]|nr:Protein of unknown function [Bacillus cereus]
MMKNYYRMIFLIYGLRKWRKVIAKVNLDGLYASQGFYNFILKLKAYSKKRSVRVK